MTTHKNLGVHIATNLKDDVSIRQQCRNMYSRGNMIIRILRIVVTQLNVAYLRHPLLLFILPHYAWPSYNIESLRHLKVAYSKIIHILMGKHHRARMSENFIRRGLDPFKVIVRKLPWSFRCKVLRGDNIVLKTIVNSIYILWSKFSRK